MALGRTAICLNMIVKNETPVIREAIQLGRSRAEYLLFLDADDQLVLPEGYRLPELGGDGYHICLAVPGRVRRRRVLGGTVPGIPGGLRTAPGGGPAAGSGGGARHGEPRVRVAGPFGLCPGGRLTRSPVPFPGSIVAGRVRFPRVATGRAVPRHGAGATALPVGERPGPGRPPGSPYPEAGGRCSGGRAGGAGRPGGTSGHPPVRPGPGAVPRPGGGPGSPP